MSSEPYPPLRRSLGFWDSVAINVGVVVGVGIFSVPQVVAQSVGSPSLILLAWLLGGLLTLFGVFCYAELASLLPHTGGTYVYLRQAYGLKTAFLYGWMEAALVRPAAIAAVAFILAEYARNVFPYPPSAVKGVALAAILMFTAANSWGGGAAPALQKGLSFLKGLAVALMAILVYLCMRGAVPAAAGSGTAEFGFLARIAPAMIPILWTYGGWHHSTFMAGEFRDTRKALPLSLIAGALMVTLLYAAMNAAYLRVLSPLEMAENTDVAAEVFGRLFGPGGRVAVAAVVVLSSMGALNANILSGARLPVALAADFPRMAWLGKASRLGNPVNSVALTGLWALALVVLGNFEQLLYFSGFMVWFFFALTGGAVFALRAKDESARVFPLPGYPFVPLAFILSSFWICLVTIRDRPLEAASGAVIVLAGLPLYYMAGRKRS